MKFELNKFFEIEGKDYDVSYAIDEYINSERYKHGNNYGEIYPIVDTCDTEDWTTIHRDLGENRIFKFDISKEEDKYFVDIDHPIAIELLQSGNCKFGKRSIVETFRDTPRIKIITLDIVLNEVEILKHVSSVKYKIDRVKEGSWFGNNVRIEYYSIFDKNIIGYNNIETKEFVNLIINETCVFKGELKDLLYGSNIKPDVFRKYLMYLDTKGIDAIIGLDEIEEHYTESNISWWHTPERCFKKVYEYGGLELVNNKYNTSNIFNLEVFATNSKYTQYFVLYSKENGYVIKYFDKLKHALDYIRENCKMSLQEYIRIKKSIDLNLKNVKECRVDIFPYLKEDTCNKTEKINNLTTYVDRLPIRTSSIVRDSSRGLDSDLIFYYKNEPINSFKVLGKEDQYEKCIFIGSSNHQDYILVSEDFTKVFVEIPRRGVLKEKFDINIVYDENSCDILGNDDEFSLRKCKKIFTPLFDEEDKRLHVCVNIKDKNILDILPTDIMDHIYNRYGKYIHSIEYTCKQFLKNIEENTKIFNSIDKKELGEYFGLYEDGVLPKKNELILDELIKIRRFVLDK